MANISRSLDITRGEIRAYVTFGRKKFDLRVLRIEGSAKRRTRWEWRLERLDVLTDRFAYGRAGSMQEAFKRAQDYILLGGVLI